MLGQLSFVKTKKKLQEEKKGKKFARKKKEKKILKIARTCFSKTVAAS